MGGAGSLPPSLKKMKTREISVGHDSMKPMETPKMEKMITREAPMVGGAGSLPPLMKPDIKVMKMSGGGMDDLDNRMKKMISDPDFSIGGNSAKKEEDAIEKNKKEEEEASEEGKIDESDAPLLTEKDARCYASRYTDIGSANP